MYMVKLQNVTKVRVTTQFDRCSLGRQRTCHVLRSTFLSASLSFLFFSCLLWRNFIVNLCAVSTSLSLLPKGCSVVPSSVATAPAEKPKFYSSNNTSTLLSNEVLPFLLDYSNIKGSFFSNIRRVKIDN